MTATSQAMSGYGKESAALQTSRGIEFQVFARITRELKSAYTAKDSKYAELVNALHANRMMWNALAVDVSNTKNELSNDLKGQIFYLSEFVNFHTKKILKGDASIAALVDVNLAVMKGLGAQESHT
ncbi:flagellar biosynthesis regulator FlaF [Litoreibacter arenae]|nr:flagellar biosynthesis regulator FlaF [Litoreibacter arenae]